MDETNPQIQLELNTEPLSYYQRRMALLGITPELNTILIKQRDTTSPITSPTYLKEIEKPEPIFRETDKGIDIYVYSLERQFIWYAKNGAKQKNHLYKITRLEVPVTNKQGKEAKYLLPKDVPTLPFFPPQLIRAYERAKEWKAANPGQRLPVNLRLNTLYMTEGYFKAFKACMHGIHTVGLASITCMKNKETEELHPEIIKLITTCEVERFVWLTDGDCRNITSKEITDGKDLYRRPNGFFNSVRTFVDVTSKLEVRKYWAHINTEELSQNNMGKPGPKGLDDLLVERADEIADITADFNDFSRREARGVYESRYLYRYDVDRGLTHVRQYLLLHDVDDFYQYHVQRRPELQHKSFKFNGSTYKYHPGEKDDEPGMCKVEIPGAAERYFRVGDNYYEWGTKPNRFGEIVNTYVERSKSTICDDHGKPILQFIARYYDECIVPDHINYQRVVNNCFNRYHPLDNEMEAGDCSTSIDFVKHIFGTHTVQVNGQPVEYWQLGMDYLTLLFKKPTQMLPILCLVSRENNTGKSTFLNWMSYLFCQNAVQVGNEDLESQFNAFWTEKLLVMCDETKVDKIKVFEKIKRLATAGLNIKQGKGTNQKQVESFLKFIFCSNNERNFITLSERDTRFWVLKVKTITKFNTVMLDELKEEIPAFMHYLYNRQMVTENKTRAWFDFELLKTEALENLIKGTRPSMEKRIRQEISELFEMDSNAEFFKITADWLTKEILKHNDKNWVKETLHEMGYTTGANGRIKCPRKVFANLPEIGSTVSLEYVTIDGSPRFYTFLRKDFTDPALITVPYDSIEAELYRPLPEKQPDLPF